MNKLYIFLLLLLTSLSAGANDLAITNISLSATPNPGFAAITFDVHWKNAWRTTSGAGNWDAAWLFAKFRTSVEAPYQHVRLAANGQTSTQYVTEVMDDSGAMLYAAGSFAGTADYRGVTLIWDYAASGITRLGEVELQIYGVEMVYIPEGSYWLGAAEGDDERDHFYTRGASYTVWEPTVFNPLRMVTYYEQDPFKVVSAGSITIGKGEGQLYYDDTFITTSDKAGPVPATFPNGYRAYYLMKYEVSQQQYVDFFNTLTPTQKLARDITGASGKNTDLEKGRNSISWNHVAGGDATTSSPHVPMGYASLYDMLAYLDWAALRPMTEMEYEKACRGPVYPKAGEYAWGTSNIIISLLSVSNSGAKDEKVLNLSLNLLDFPFSGNATYNSTILDLGSGYGPYRCGIFSYMANATRISSGAGYYGNMELSGNQWEGVIGIASASGRAFSNAHGDGTLTSAGMYDVPTWPTTLAGTGLRGGYTLSSADYLQTADRSLVHPYTDMQASGRYSWLQFRGVRGL